MEELPPLPPAIPPAPKPYNSRTSLAIALVVSAIFLIAAAGVCYWLLTKPAGTVTEKPAGDGTDTIKNVTWIAPANLPGTYVRRDQNTPTAATSYYFDAALGCGFTTNVQPLSQGVTVKQSVVDAAKAAQSYGIATTNTTDANEHHIKNENGKQAYTFQSVLLEQTVAVTGVPYDSQRTIVAYKKLGAKVASISYSCKTPVWDGKKAELQNVANAFMVKTEE